MDRIGLELSDVGILAAGGAPIRMLPVDEAAYESPGFALPMKKKLLVGRAAFQQSRLHPRDTNNRFWAHLSTHAISQRMGVAANYAEVAFQHIELIQRSLGQPDAAWHVATPGFLDEGRLGILLGIFRELQIPIGSLVSLPVAACRPHAGTRRMLHLDVHLHAAEMTELVLDGDLQMDQTQTISNVGWGELLEGMAKGVADEFVRTTRFDPLHQADSEQQLFNALLGIVWRKERTLRETIELASKRSTHSLTVQPEMLVDANREQRATVVEAIQRMVKGDTACAIRLSHRAAMVPGLVEELTATVSGGVDVLPLGSAAMGILDADFGRGSDGGQAGVTYVTRRPGGGGSAIPAGSVPEQSTVEEDVVVGAQPTHVLHGHRAIPISHEPLLVGGQSPSEGRSLCIRADGADIADEHLELVRMDEEVLVRCLDQAPVWIDGQRIDGVASVFAGQVLSFGGPDQDLLFIRVEPDHGT